ncbi:MAG: hypothetical protein U5N58_05730 [Actinomycetota bacterium]|nr:hypothetical protein [Actinomycetota bacterium]
MGKENNLEQLEEYIYDWEEELESLREEANNSEEEAGKNLKSG